MHPGLTDSDVDRVCEALVDLGTSGMKGNDMEIEVLTGSQDAGDRQFTVFDSDAAPRRRAHAPAPRRGHRRHAGLAAPPVVLPDFCHKAKSEMPSSIAVATTGEIRPTLTDAALNCGMALMTLDVERPPASAVTEFYRQVAERFPSPPTWRRELTAKEVLRAAAEGADFAAERYGLGEDELDHVEERGRLDIDAYGGAQRAAKELPWLVVQMSRLRFGGIGPSTHFLELQEVEDILDPAAAAELGIRAGQVTVQFHNGGGVLTGQLGALYARRKSASRMLRAEMAVQKPLTHLLTPRSGLRQRLAAYFTEGCPSVPVDGDDGRRVLLATRLAMNYGFAYRMATYADLRRMARSAFGATASLVVDSPHNSIYEEDVGGTQAFVHRHNACRAYPGGADGGSPGLRPDRPAAAAARHQPHLVVPVRAGTRRPPQPVHGLPWHRQHHLRLRTIRPVRARPAGPDDGPLPLRRHRARGGAAPG